MNWPSWSVHLENSFNIRLWTLSYGIRDSVRSFVKTFIQNVCMWRTEILRCIHPLDVGFVSSFSWNDDLLCSIEFRDHNDQGPQWSGTTMEWPQWSLTTMVRPQCSKTTMDIRIYARDHNGMTTMVRDHNGQGPQWQGTTMNDHNGQGPQSTGTTMANDHNGGTTMVRDHNWPNSN